MKKMLLDFRLERSIENITGAVAPAAYERYNDETYWNDFRKSRR